MLAYAQHIPVVLNKPLQADKKPHSFQIIFG